jgi:hypothetical protein
VPSTSSLMPSQAAPSVKLIEDTCRKMASAAETPVRVAVSAVTVPIEVARTSLNILRLSEELLEEVVFLLRSMRPVVAAVSTSHQADHFDAVFRTLEQIQHSADAIARTPIGVVRSVLAPARTSRDGGGHHAQVIPTRPRPERASVPLGPGGWLVGAAGRAKRAAALPAVRPFARPTASLQGRADAVTDQADDQRGRRVLEAEHQMRTPSVAVRIASITVTMPSIAVGKPSRSLRLPGLGHRRPRFAT